MNEIELFHGPNAGYVLDLYEQYCQNPESLDEATRQFFAAWLQTADAAQSLARTPGGNGLRDGSEDDGERVAQPAPAAVAYGAAGKHGDNAIRTGGKPPESPAVEPYPSTIAASKGGEVGKSEHAERSRSASDNRSANGANAGGTAVDHKAMDSPANGVSMDNGLAVEPPSPATTSVSPQSTGSTLMFAIQDIVSAARLVRFIRELGHKASHIDPLGSAPPGDPEVELETQGLTPELLKAMPPTVVKSMLAQGTSNAWEAIERLRRVYSGSIGYDEAHVLVAAERDWLRDAAESGHFFEDFDTDYQRELLERLTEVEAFEQFLHQKFLGQKRFSLQGSDMLVPMLDTIIHEAAVAGTHEVVIGMAHRGRLNVLAHVLGKPYSAVLAEFQGPNHYNRATYLGWTGDVKYHLGARKAYREGGVYEMPLTLVPNPSHLEFVNPVVEGRARAAQEQRDQPGAPEKDSRASLPILIHGDASFPGQGIVAETLNMSRLEGYHTGGTIHIIINNQIGFTTDMLEARSTLYAGDLAKGFEIPVLHVNADDPKACIAVARMAWAYREKFAKDILIDLIGYRRWGHNEGDEPTYTQPRMYEIIVNHPTVREIWARTLIKEGVTTEEKATTMMNRAMNRLQRALQEVERRGRIEATVAVSVSSLIHRPVSEPLTLSTDQITELNEALLTFPEEFALNPKLERSFQRRHTALGAERGIDWAHAETLAFATILSEGIPIRLSGQDTERGTFSQRHLVLHNYKMGERYVPLQRLPQARASFAVYNSPLSESAALGFEYGFSMHAPDTLVLWEAQFGDFANGAQVIIDQFIVSGYAKWGQQPSLVMLLPHGYEGQGPDHSNARPERFLQLAADNNIRVVNCTTSAQYFHLLRRQATLLQSDPRPLIVFTPKSLLRHPMSMSSLSDLTDGRFHPVLPPEGEHNPEDVTRLILCSGKVYVDLMSKQQRNGKPALPQSVAVARVEELYPFPSLDLDALLGTYLNVHELVWLQEEPANMGPWNYIRPKLRELISNVKPARNITILYCGRPESASTAEGSHMQHEVEQDRILHEVLHGVAEKHLSSKG